MNSWLNVAKRGGNQTGGNDVKSNKRPTTPTATLSLQHRHVEQPRPTDRFCVGGLCAASPTFRPSSVQPPHYCVNSAPRVPVSDPQSPARPHCKSHLRPNAVFCLIIAIKLGWNECDCAEPDKNANEWVPLSTSVFTAPPPPHSSPLLPQPHPTTTPSHPTPRHATAQVVPAWGCPGRVRCPPGSCRGSTAPQMSAASFTTTNLLEAGCVREWGGGGGCGSFVCVCFTNVCRVQQRPTSTVNRCRFIFIVVSSSFIKQEILFKEQLLFYDCCRPGCLLFNGAEMWLGGNRFINLTGLFTHFNCSIVGIRIKRWCSYFQQGIFL